LISFFLIALVFALKWKSKSTENNLLIAQLEKKEKDLEASKSEIKNIIHSTQKNGHCLTHSLRDIAIQFNSSISKLEGDLTYYYKIFNEVTARYKKELDEYLLRKDGVNYNVSVSVKLLVPLSMAKNIYLQRNPGDQKGWQRRFKGQQHCVITAYRDPETWKNKLERKETKKVVYSINGNTAFQYIFDGEGSIWLHDNLPILNKAYKNETKNWSNFYTATIVSAIRSTNSLGTIIYYGFLTADCIRHDDSGKIFDDTVIRELAAKYSDLLATLILYVSTCSAYQKGSMP